MKDWLRIWSDLDEPIGPREYFKTGLLLAAAKYALDAALIWFGAGIVWTPVDYFAAGTAWTKTSLSGAPSWLLATLGLTTLPFVSVGLSLSIRRALDAGASPWLGLLFFIPGLNYAFMAAMSLLPSRPQATTPDGRPRGVPNTLRAIAVGSVLCIGLAGISIMLLASYGTALFFGVPFTVGAVTSYVYNRDAVTSFKPTFRVVAAVFAISAAGLLALAFEGLICILMAAPLILMLGALGAQAGLELAQMRADSRGILIALLVVPLTTVSDRDATRHEHEVRSSVEIDAPPDSVWKHVISFSTLPPPTELIFRAGIAYPVRARIQGSGVGAIRYCEFSTGSFVEPITHWEPGKRLSFGVSDHPPPMREWSPYRIAPPHLEGYFAARRGEFRLVALPGGRTRLEGSTWYTLDVAPPQYWAPMADALVHTIHQRVLRHIKAESER